MQTCNLAMAKRGFKLLALVLPILLGRSCIALIAIPRVTQNKHKCPSTTRKASLEAGEWAQKIDPFSGWDIAEGTWAGTLGCKQEPSLDFQTEIFGGSRRFPKHAKRLAKILVRNAKKSEKARNIFLPNISLPLIPVNGTQFQHLVSNVLSDVTLTGVTSIHAEPGAGKSVAVSLSMLGWAADNPHSITVLIRESLENLRYFFRVGEN